MNMDERSIKHFFRSYNANAGAFRQESLTHE